MRQERAAANPAPTAAKPLAVGSENVCATFHLEMTPNQIDLTNFTKEQLKSLNGEVRLQIRQVDGTVATSQRNVFIRSSEMTWSDVTETSAAVALGVSLGLCGRSRNR